MLALFALAGLAIGFAYGGRLADLERNLLPGFGLPVAALAIQLAAKFLCPEYLPRIPYYGLAVTAAYLLSLVFVFRSRRIRLFFWPALGGLLANYTVIALNDFYMPLSAKVLSQTGFTIPVSEAMAYRVADASTKLSFLGDVIYCPFPKGFASLGDILLGIAILFALVYMLRPGLGIFGKKPGSN